MKKISLNLQLSFLDTDIEAALLKRAPFKTTTGRVCCTNGPSVLLADESLFEDLELQESEGFPNVESIIEAQKDIVDGLEISAEQLLNAINSVKDVHVTCEKCSGSGEVECDCCGHSSECESCDGFGYEIFSGIIRLHKSNFRRDVFVDLYSVCKELSVESVKVLKGVPGHATMYLFQVGEVQVVLMPYRKELDSRHEVYEIGGSNG